MVGRQLLIENTLLCIVGWAAGFGVAAVIAAFAPRLLVSEPAMLTSPEYASSFAVDWRVFFFGGLLAAATVLMLALVPLAQVRRPELIPALQAGFAARSTSVCCPVSTCP